MAAAHSPAHVRSLYRSLLRELPPRPILRAPRSALHTQLRNTFAASSSPSLQSSSSASSSSAAAAPPHQHHQARAEAEQLVAYLRSQRQYVTLIERYNPGMDMDEEERVRLTARRVGMDLPVGYADGTGAGEK
ncbi:phosphoglycerate mutase family protein [Purpureocillium lavendulum]|uniref:Phosphoglycerate mutase family protein n=1 Tax=Purpureocillium lavendulum TaxID=1247861 RepID=A0AB34FHJ6_9HYPO|nr:phosphoglycerate mutase family protein [Purpureocillium lavendulum]